MSLFTRLSRSNFFIKLGSWEYWPFGIIQGPLFIYWIWLSLKARSLVYFTASNPGIVMGGMFGESKFEVLEKVPTDCKPKTFLVKVPARAAEVDQFIRDSGLTYPVIFKPDLGERGWMVKRIHNLDDIESYLSQIRIDFLIQELVTLPLEFGVYYVRYPTETKGRVTSITGKEMLSVTGDGKTPLRQLILSQDRARLQWEVLSLTYRDSLERILPAGERMELVSIGNHCLGTMFLDCNHLITEKLSDSFDRISRKVEGFYFGRYDLRTASIGDLESGHVMVMELNGCGAEPAHIYQPGFSIWKAMGVLWNHWKTIYEISAENHRLGVPYLSFVEARRIYRTFKMRAAP